MSLPRRIVRLSENLFALLVKWYNTCFVIRDWQFDSVAGHHNKEIIMAALVVLIIMIVLYFALRKF